METITAPVTEASVLRRNVVRTALAVEPRDGRLWIFVPPVSTTEDYVELIMAIEDTAAALAMPILVEGYSPPYDPRLRVIKVTPDPGVIEVNVHPAANWRELVDNTVKLYEQARQSRLGLRYQGGEVAGAKLSGQVEMDFFGGKAALGNGINMG